MGRIVIATAVMVAVTTAVDQNLAAVFGGATFPARGMRLAISITAGLVTLAGAAKLLRIQEFDEVVALVRKHT